MAFDYPAQSIAAYNELRKKRVFISDGGIRSIWLRHNLELFEKRLHNLEEKDSQRKFDPYRSPANGFGTQKKGEKRLAI